jgi:flagellar biosynthesis protein FlhA
MIKQAARYGDLAIGIGVISILAVMIVPLPSVLLDVLLALNITVALMVLLVTIYTTEPLQFSIFPGLLLILTLFRLALNVASTRLILADGYAGEIILAFGTFVVKGNYLVGVIIFLILFAIQFVVITKGASRIAEVAARFTLDAMPGKQMSIDADLNAGAITDVEARARRKKLSSEAEFYGAMDGASKFVRGDAIAGVLITGINILGGFVVGVAQRGLSLTDALATYTILTIGDGLVSQIPALIISTAAGIIISRASSESNLGEDMAVQLLSRPRPLFVTAGALACLGLLPGLPFVPFALLAVCTGAAGFTVRRDARLRALAEIEEKTKPDKPAEEAMEEYLHIDPLELEIGYGLIPLVDAAHGGDLLNRITMLRKQAATELGILVPPMRVRDNIELKSNEYVIKIKGEEIARGIAMTGAYLALDPGGVAHEMDGIRTTDPTYGLPAVWISERQKEEAEFAGYTVVEGVAVLATHLMETLRRHASKLLGRQEVQTLIDYIRKHHPAVIEGLVPDTLPLGTVQKVLQGLLDEQVSIRDLVTVFEAMADHAHVSKEPEILMEYVRNAMGQRICRPFISPSGTLSALMLDPALEQQISGAIQDALNNGTHFALPPDVVRHITDELTRHIESMVTQDLQPVVVCSPIVRGYFKRLVRSAFPQLTVLSYGELGQTEIETVGIVGGAYAH